MGGSGKRLWGIVPGFQILQARPTLAWGFSHFDTMSKIVCRLLDGYNTSKVLFFLDGCPVPFLLLFFRQTLSVRELVVGPKGHSQDLLDRMTCQEYLKRLERR